MQFFKKKAKTAGRVGITSNASQLAIAHLVERDGEPHLLQCERFALDAEHRDEGLAKTTEMVQELGLEGLECSIVCEPTDYSIHLVEAPSVEPDEMKAAVRWKIKDLLDMKVEEAAIDLFELPEDAYRGRKMVYVVASRKSRIKDIINRVSLAGLVPAVIDIPELAMKNISSRYIDDSAGAAFMDLRRTGSTINITRNTDLYLTRRINTQLDADVMQSAEWPSLKDRLALEIQRSLDYYESQMGHGQISKIYIAHRVKDTEGMLATLNEMLTAEVCVLDLAQHLDSDVELTPETQQICMSAIGGTLRGMKLPVAMDTSGTKDQVAA